MKSKLRLLAFALVCSLLLLVAGAALADGAFSLPRWALSSGATDAVAGVVSLRATLGQPVVGQISNDDLSLGQGFWHAGGPSVNGKDLYLPLVLR